MNDQSATFNNKSVIASNLAINTPTLTYKMNENICMVGHPPTLLPKGGSRYPVNHKRLLPQVLPRQLSISKSSTEIVSNDPVAKVESFLFE